MYNWDISTKNKWFWIMFWTQYKKVRYFVWFGSLRPSQQFFSYVGTGLLGLNQY